MRLPSLNKIFIRRMDFTMRKNGVVITRRFYVSWRETSESRFTFTDVFYDWHSAYRAFRFHSSFCGHFYVALRLSPRSDSLGDNIVYRYRFESYSLCRWYDGSLQTEGNRPLLFRVLPEFLDIWSSDGVEIFVSRHDIEQLSSSWGVSVDSLLSQVELCDDVTVLDGQVEGRCF